MEKLTCFLVVFFCSLQCYPQQRNGQLAVSNFILRECLHEPALKDTLSVRSIVSSLCSTHKVKRIVIAKNATGSSHFNPLNRIMYLNVTDTNDICRVLMNEICHAQQFATHPVFYSLLFVKGFVDTFRGVFSLTRAERVKVRMLRKNGCNGLIARFWVVYERQEFIYGSAEHNAHQVRQPRIERMFYAMIAKKK